MSEKMETLEKERTKQIREYLCNNVSEPGRGT